MRARDLKLVLLVEYVKEMMHVHFGEEGISGGVVWGWAP